MPAGDMDPVYSIGVNNRYDMIDSDMIEDPLELSLKEKKMSKLPNQSRKRLSRLKLLWKMILTVSLDNIFFVSNIILMRFCSKIRFGVYLLN